MKRGTLIGIIAGAVLVAGGIGAGFGASIASTPAPTPTVSVEAAPVESVTPDSEPLTAETPTAGEPDTVAFIAMVRSRLATFNTQIPNATDEQLLAAGLAGCERILSGEGVEGMSVITDEAPGTGGYFYDSNAIIAGAMIHLCPETLG